MHSMDDLSRYQTGEDALAYERTKLAAALNKRQTEKLVNQLEGIFDTALADNSLDLSEATAGSETDENMFSLAERDSMLSICWASTLRSCRPLLSTRVLQHSCSCRVADLLQPGWCNSLQQPGMGWGWNWCFQHVRLASTTASG